MGLEHLAEAASSKVVQTIGEEIVTWHVRHLGIAEIVGLEGGPALFLGAVQPPEPEPDPNMPEDMREALAASKAAAGRKLMQHQLGGYTAFAERVAMLAVARVESRGAVEPVRLVPVEEEDPSANRLAVSILDIATLGAVVVAATAALTGARAEVLPFRPKPDDRGSAGPGGEEVRPAPVNAGGGG